VNGYRGLGYRLHYWRTTTGLEVDLVLYGERGIKAIEVTRSHSVRPRDVKGLQAFLEDYPMAEVCLVYGGTRRHHEGGLEVVPVGEFLSQLEDRLH
jgi:predicted AAA+ superfamily ATPase